MSDVAEVDSLEVQGGIYGFTIMETPESRTGRYHLLTRMDASGILRFHPTVLGALQEAEAHLAAILSEVRKEIRKLNPPEEVPSSKCSSCKSMGRNDRYYPPPTPCNPCHLCGAEE